MVIGECKEEAEEDEEEEEESSSVSGLHTRVSTVSYGPYNLTNNN